MKSSFLTIAMFVSGLLMAQGPNLQWARLAGGPGYEAIVDLELGPNGSLYAVGSFDDSVYVTPSVAFDGTGAFMAKYDANGALIWANKLNYTTSFKACAVDAVGNMYVTGYFFDSIDIDPSAAVSMLYSNGNQDMFVAKYDVNGAFQWGYSYGNAGSAIGFDIGVDAAGDVVVIGEYTGLVNFDRAGSNPGFITTPTNSIYVFVAKYDGNGDFVWVKEIATNATSLSLSPCLSISPNGKIAVGTHTRLASNDRMTFKTFSSTGSPLASFLTANTTYSGKITGIAMDTDGNIYTSGVFSGTADFDASSNTSTLTANDRDYFFAKYDSAGNYIWAKKSGATGNDEHYTLKISADNQLYMSGYTANTMDFDFNSGTYSLSGNGPFVAKYDTASNLIWAFRPYGYIVRPQNIIPLPNDEFLTAGDFNSQATFVPNQFGTVTYQATGYDGFFAKYGPNCTTPAAFTVNGNTLTANVQSGSAYLQWADCNSQTPIAGANFPTYTATVSGSYTLFVADNGCLDTADCVTVTVSGPVSVQQHDQNNIQIYPNPTQNNLFFQLGNLQGPIFIEILDLQGRQLQTATTENTNTFELPLNLPAGLYFARITSAEQQQTLKFIKE